MAITQEVGDCFYCGARGRLWRHPDTPALLCRAHYSRTWVYGHPSIEAWLRLTGPKGTILGRWHRREGQWRERDEAYHAHYRIGLDRAAVEAQRILSDEISRESPRYATPWVIGVFANLKRRKLEILCRRIVVSQGWLLTKSEPTPPDAVKSPGHLQASLAAHLLRNAHDKSNVTLTWRKRYLEQIFTAMRHSVGRLQEAMSPALLAFRQRMVLMERANQAQPSPGDFDPGYVHIWKNSSNRIMHDRRATLWGKKMTLEDYRLLRAARRADSSG